MELVEQHQLPRALQLLSRVAAQPVGAHAGEKLRLTQQELTLAVVPLIACLRGVGSTMQLQIELAHPHRQVFRFCLRLCKEIAGKLQRHARHPFYITQASGVFQHLRGGTASAVAVTVDVERTVGAVVLTEVAHVVHQLARCHVAVVGVGGRKVREDARAVDALPQEGVMREPVHLVPADFLCHKVADARLLQDLWQARRVAEYVGQPQFHRLDAELLHPEPLAVQNLSHQRLAAGDITIRLHPHRAGYLPLSLAHLLLDALVETRSQLLHPRILLRLRTDELVFGVHVHQAQGGSEGVNTLLLCAFERPQPGGIDMGMSDGADLVGRGASGLVIHLRNDLAAAGNAVSVVGVKCVDGGVEGIEQLRPARLVRRQFLQHLQRDAHVEVQRGDVAVPHRQIRHTEGEWIWRRLHRLGIHAHIRVHARRLYVEGDFLTSPCGLGDQILAVASVDTLSWVVSHPHYRFRPAVYQRTDGFSAPFGGNHGGKSKPRIAPYRSPGVPGLHRHIRLFRGVFGGDFPFGAIYRRLHRYLVRPDAGLKVVADETLHPRQSEFRMLEHGCPLVTSVLGVACMR
ncbi:hypothetical protein HRbin16_03224 [bacterium HR16]|nr:hypothetical protein HRbin16_03224 [bacterium HR16]